jgi:NADH-quinone oxidoreductase subunit L
VDAGWLFLIPFLPLWGAAVNGLCGEALQRRFGRHAITFVAIGVVVAAMGLSIGAVAQLAALPAGKRVLTDHLFTMLQLGGLRVDFTITLDALSAVMILVITVVGALIHVYAVGYMADEPAYWRFFAYLNLFVFAMLLLVLGDGFVTLFFGWEGVGLCSYLLVGFWYAEPKNARAGMKAFVVNRVGDWGFLVGVALLFWALAGSWSSIDRRWYADAAHLAPTLSFRALETQLAVPAFAQAFAAKTIFGAPVALVVALFLLLGACGKSAQAPLHVWLPDAMAGPTPVSALIHAATMVTAGVYLVARLRFLFVLSPAAMTVIACIGIVTALGGALLGLFQYDLKRVLAYSTISQLGFMFVALGVGAFGAALFHLVTHACFKACLFLGSGSVIHGMHRLTHARHTGHLDEDDAAAESETDRHALAGGDDEHQPAQLDPRMESDPTDPQDMRNMGGLGALMPVTRWSYLIACWAIAGFPWAAGFWSKDEILAAAFAHSYLLWFIGVNVAGLTAFYMFRSYYLTFEARPPSAAHRRHVRESPRVMTWVLMALAVASIVVGPVGAWLMPRLSAAHEPLSRTMLGLMAASVAMATVGWALARAFYKDESELAMLRAANRLRYEQLHAFAFDTFRVDELYEATFVRGFVAVARAAAWFDRIVVDGVVVALAALVRAAAWITGAIDEHIVDGAVNGLANAILGGGRALGRVQTGRVNQYVLGVAVGVVVLIVLTSWL